MIPVMIGPPLDEVGSKAPWSNTFRFNFALVADIVIETVASAHTSGFGTVLQTLYLKVTRPVSPSAGT
ncbi:hypothetical protein MCERE19_04428 [Spirosomataceae bacterium]